MLPDGRIVWANSEGQVRLGPNFILREVLFVPGFLYNLISIGKLTDDIPCILTVFPNFCIVQDLTSKTLIGAGSADYERWHWA